MIHAVCWGNLKAGCLTLEFRMMFKTTSPSDPWVEKKEELLPNGFSLMFPCTAQQICLGLPLFTLGGGRG